MFTILRLLCRPTRYYSAGEWAGGLNTGDPSASQYSILNDLEFYRRPDNTLNLKMVWPDLDPFCPGCSLQFKQSTNPVQETSGNVAGFTLVRDDYDAKAALTGAGSFTGLRYNTYGTSLLDGQAKSGYYFAVGQTEAGYASFPSALAGPILNPVGTRNKVKQLEVYANECLPPVPTATVAYNLKVYGYGYTHARVNTASLACTPACDTATLNNGKLHQTAFTYVNKKQECALFFLGCFVLSAAF